MRFRFLLAALIFSFAISLPAQNPVISVDAAHPGAAINPGMFGIFFEDINFGADGGLYPELVKNRSFEFQEPLTGWHEVLGFNTNGLTPHHGEMAVRSASARATEGRRPEPLFTVVIDYETLLGRISQLEQGPVVPPGSLLPWLDTATFERRMSGLSGLRRKSTAPWW